jgi:hypothetical protein
MERDQDEIMITITQRLKFLDEHTFASWFQSKHLSKQCNKTKKKKKKTDGFA